MQEGKIPRRRWMKSTKYPNAGTTGITMPANGKEEDIPKTEEDGSRKTLKAAQKPRRAI